MKPELYVKKYAPHAKKVEKKTKKHKIITNPK